VSGFSSPDPARADDTAADPPPDGDDPPDDPEPIDGESVEVIAGDVSCETCAHYDVCAYYPAMVSALDDPPTAADEQPITPEHVARICDQYDPVEDD